MVPLGAVADLSAPRVSPDGNCRRGQRGVPLALASWLTLMLDLAPRWQNKPVLGLPEPLAGHMAWVTHWPHDMGHSLAT